MNVSIMYIREGGVGGHVKIKKNIFFAPNILIFKNI